MGGLRRLCKLYGRITIQGVKYVWDYAQDKPRVEKEMTMEEWAKSERIKWLWIKQQKMGKKEKVD